MGRIRARNTEEIRERKQRILNVVASLLSSNSLSKITMSMITNSAGIARSTPYVYWRTREELFLENIEELFLKLLASLEKKLKARRPTLEEYIAVYSEEIASSGHVLELVGQLYQVIEPKISADLLRKHKEKLFTSYDRIHRLLSNSAGISIKEAEQFSMTSFVLVLGWNQIYLASRESSSNESSGSPKEGNGLFQTALIESMKQIARGMGIASSR